MIRSVITLNPHNHMFVGQIASLHLILVFSWNENVGDLPTQWFLRTVSEIVLLHSHKFAGRGVNWKLACRRATCLYPRQKVSNPWHQGAIVKFLSL